LFGCSACVWGESNGDVYLFEAGITFATEEDAEENYKAIFEPLRIDK